MNDLEWAQRIAVLEEKVSTLTDTLAKHSLDSQERDKALGDKLDGLLELKSKGMGAFWLASTILGTGIVSMIAMLSDWLKG